MPEQIIPSKFVRDYAEKVGWKFSDLDKAALTHHMGLPPGPEMAALEALKLELTDEEVIAQIDDYIAQKQAALEYCKTGGDNVMFALTYHDEKYDEEECRGFFREYADARARGRKLGCEHQIAKHLIIGPGRPEPPRVVGKLNPYLMKDRPFEELVTLADAGDEGDPVATVTISPNGHVMRCWSSEPQPKTREDLAREFDPQHFKNAFVELPNPFETGDIVRVVGPIDRQEHPVGIVDTSQEELKDYLERIKAFPAADFFDAGLTVQVVLEDGSISHQHIPSIYLEPYEMPKDDRDRELVEEASRLIAGKGSLDWFCMCYDRRKHGPGEIIGEIDGFTIEKL